jgi:hypothetical protein
MEWQMRLKLNWIQRGLLILGGLLLVMLALGSMTDYPRDRALGTLQFIAGIVLFVVAASSRNEKTDAE